MKLKNILARFRKSESGASMVEYGVALLVVAAVGIVTMNTLGGNVNALTTAACNTLAGSNVAGTTAC